MYVYYRAFAVLSIAEIKIFLRPNFLWGMGLGIKTGGTPCAKKWGVGFFRFAQGEKPDGPKRAVVHSQQAPPLSKL
jgi:hypothetical protein